MKENSLIIYVQIALVAVLLIYFYFRRKNRGSGQRDRRGRVEAKVIGGKLEPAELRIPRGELSLLVISRLDREPREELFEIEEFELYELLPALNATIMKVQPRKRGTFPIVLAGERQVGTVTVE
ncbi:MAG: cupredoxin domain-containing protein [bacterium]|nr:cupredoxin domain-containing protein [bacterium]